ncbi:MAG: hypothetical protein M3Q07_15575 [Pseudobdellovibrionaceae bacterium]|nr:hypothetical protein [Pseudobdellovibrionaceae bacterium]
MLFARLRIAAMCFAFIGACSKKAKNQTHGEYIAAVLSEDAVPLKRPMPTRPEGGVVEGKSQILDPEEAERRRNKNMIEPIVFGKSVGGITMKMPYSEVFNTLVYYGSRDGIDIFQEHIVVAWSAGADPVPFQVGVQEGYAGTLKLPEPYGEISLGQQMAGKIANQDELRQFMLVIGAAFENQPVSSYDCEKSLTCQLNENATFYMLDFRLGGIYLTKAAGLPVGFLYFTQPQKFFAPLTDPILHNLSIGGLTFQTKRTTAELRLGPEVDIRLENGILFSYYDRNNFAVSWGQDTTPAAFKAVGTYQGTQNFGGSIGIHKLGDSFSSFASTSDNGTALMLALDRSLNNRTADYNCSTTTPATCEAVIVKNESVNWILIVIDRSVYSFTNDENRTWLSVGMREP